MCAPKNLGPKTYFMNKRMYGHVDLEIASHLALIGASQSIEHIKALRRGIVEKLVQHYLSSCFPNFLYQILFFFFCIYICSKKHNWALTGLEIPTGPEAGLANSMILECSWNET